MVDLSDVVSNDVITSARANLVKDYIQDGTHKLNTLSVDVGGTEVIGSGTNVVTSVADNGNVVGLSVTQNDVTNNPNGINVVNAGTGNGLNIDQNGNGVALNIDSECDNDTDIISVLPVGTSPGAFKVTRNDDVDGNVVMRLGNNYLWVDSTGDLRIDSSQPTSDTSGTVVGSQS